MEYLEMVLRLKQIYIKEIVFVSCGAFYIAIAEDAVLLHRELDLQVNCIRKNMCKVGIPKSSIEKYIKKLNSLGNSYIVLDFNKEKKTLTSIYSKEGKDKECSLINVQCSKCKKNKYKIKTEYETSMYKMLEDVLFISKIEDRKQCLEIVNKIDARLNTQRIYLRIMCKNKWIDNKKFNIVMEQIYEIGKITGGLIKYYAKDIKK